MAGDTFGEMFRITNWGESHGPAIGVVIEGCPPRLSITPEDIQRELDRRRPGQSHITTERDEKDHVQILSGIFEGKTTGAPISLMIQNKDHRSEDYAELAQIYRPSHAGFTYDKKYGIRDPRGGGRSSARLTAGSVAAGAIAQKILRICGIEIVAYVKRIQEIEANIDTDLITREHVDAQLVRCPHPDVAVAMQKRIEETKAQGDSLGGIIECVIRNVPAGLGEPVYDKLEADLAKAMLAINATKGFEIGSGFSGSLLTGSQHNDEFYNDEGVVKTRTNNAGGVIGGISNGMPIIFRVAFKPTATIKKQQNTVDREGNDTTLAAKGRHDPCVLPRAVPIVEAMAALVLCDHYLRNNAQCGGNYD